MITSISKKPGQGKSIVSGFLLVVMLAWIALLVGNTVCSASTVALSWDPNSESTLAGYKVYYKADSSALPFDGVGATEGASPINVHNQTTATVSGLDPNKTYYFAITAYDTSGAESPYSNIVTITESVAPTSAITSPANNSTVSGTVSVVASASDNVGVTKVEFYVNGVLQSSDTSTPYMLSWNTSSLAKGTYTLTAKAYDAANNAATSSPVIVSVVSDTTAPTVSITSPSNNATISGTVSVTAGANDNVAVSRVDFYVNGTLRASVNTPPYNYNWNTATESNGAGTLSCKAYDATGNIGTSSTVAVTINNAGQPNTATYTISDALLALQIGFGNVNPTVDQITRLDVAPVVSGKSMPNGKIDTGDAIVILSKIVGKI